MTPVKKAKPYLTLDAWRGFAALWVVLAHSCLSTPFQKVSPLVNQEQRYYLFSLAGYLGVQIFFVISGYCIASSAMSSLGRNAGTSDFLKARLRRIYPPYLLALTLAAVYSLALSLFLFVSPWHRQVLAASPFAAVNLLHKTAPYYLANLTLSTRPLHLPPVLPVSWTLNYELAFYAIVGLGLLLARRGRDPLRLLNGLHVLTLTTLGLLMLRPEGILFPFDLWPQFGLGVLAYDLLTQPRRAFTRWALALVVLETLAFAGLYTHSGSVSAFEHWRHSSFPSRVLVSLLFFGLLLLLYRRDEEISRLPPVRFLAWVGGFSYTLYLTHFLCVNLFSICGDLLGVTAATFPLIYCVKVVGSVGLARLLYPCLEKPFLHGRRRLPQGVAQLSSLDTIPKRVVS